MTREFSCGAILYQQEAGVRRFLLVQMNQGHWSFPKGHMEKGETEAITAIREIREETNLQVRLIPGFREVTRYHPAPQVEKEVVYFLAIPTSADIKTQAAEIRAAEWFDFLGAARRLTFQNDVNILWMANDFLDRKEQ
jgi:8-oxo-dGTP pyrophosphatase MutT (NUDIX family)